jgi:uroporphyrinogen III methyltransferase/synthase
VSTTSTARPLAGRRVLVTRPRAQSGALITHLEAVGARAVIAPAIRIIPPADRVPLLDAAEHVERFDWIVFSSTNAVDAFAAARAETERSRTSAGAWPRIAAVGVRTADRLRSHDLDPALVPAEYRAEALVEALTADGSLSGARVLLPRSEIARETIADGLRSAGAVVTEVVAYRTVAESPGGAPDVCGMLSTRQLDAVTFTSGSAVRSFVQMHGPQVIELLRTTVVAVIGPVTADAAREHGVRVDVQPDIYTAEAMVDALARHFEGRH